MEGADFDMNAVAHMLVAQEMREQRRRRGGEDEGRRAAAAIVAIALLIRTPHFTFSLFQAFSKT